MKRVTPSTARCCKKRTDEMVEPVEELRDGVETVNRLYYLGDKVNASGKCEIAIERVG